MSFIYVGLGGALGAAARYAVSIIPINADFPILTLLTNFLGAFLWQNNKIMRLKKS